MASAALISVTPLLLPSLSMSWTSRTRISSLMRGPSLAAGCGVLIGRRMGTLSFAVAPPPFERAPYRLRIDGTPNGEPSRSGVFRFKSTPMRVPICARLGRDLVQTWSRLGSDLVDRRPLIILRRLEVGLICGRTMVDNGLKFLAVGEGTEQRAIAVRQHGG